MKPYLNLQEMSWPAHHIAANFPGQGHGIGTLHALPGAFSLTAGHVVQGSIGDVTVRHRVDVEPMDDGAFARYIVPQDQDYSLGVPLYHVNGEEAGLPERVHDWLGFLVRTRVPDFAIFQSDNGSGKCPFRIPTALYFNPTYNFFTAVLGAGESFRFDYKSANMRLYAGLTGTYFNCEILELLSDSSLKITLKPLVFRETYSGRGFSYLFPRRGDSGSPFTIWNDGREILIGLLTHLEVNPQYIPGAGIRALVQPIHDIYQRAAAGALHPIELHLQTELVEAIRTHNPPYRDHGQLRPIPFRQTAPNEGESRIQGGRFVRLENEEGFDLDIVNPHGAEFEYSGMPFEQAGVGYPFREAMPTKAGVSIEPVVNNEPMYADESGWDVPLRVGVLPGWN
jgi:hypothetical protein